MFDKWFTSENILNDMTSVIEKETDVKIVLSFRPDHQDLIIVMLDQKKYLTFSSLHLDSNTAKEIIIAMLEKISKSC